MVYVFFYLLLAVFQAGTSIRKLQKWFIFLQKCKFLRYRKIPKISPGAYTFQSPFLRGLFLEGPIFGGAYVRREICISKLIGLACSGKEIYHFCFVLLCIRGQIPSTSPPGGLYSEGQFNGGFFALRFWGAYIWRGFIHRGAYFRNFTVWLGRQFS